MTTYIPVLTLILALLLIALVLLQRPNTDSAGAFSADSAGTHTKRGLEKTVYQLTILVAVLFVLSAVAGLLLY